MYNSISSSGVDTEEPMADEATARAWLAEAGFAEGDLRSEIDIMERMKCPMAWACQNGELGVCKSSLEIFPVFGLASSVWPSSFLME